jgi:zinc/manganese transport system substrate-binding protein
MKMSGVFAISIMLAGWLVSCGAAEEQGNDDRLLLVATTTILGDVLTNVAGDDARVEVLMPVGADPHDFQASAAQMGDLNRADLVVANGLGLEEGVEAALDSAADDGVRVFEVGPLLDPLPLEPAVEEEEHDEEHEDEEGHERDGLDPHVWLDPVRMADAARLIATQLEEIEPEIDWTTRADRYAEELAATDAMISEQLSAIPEQSRRLVTNHESLGYFANRYDFEVVGVVIPGGSTLADPSSAHLAELVELMRREGITVIFGETTEPDALATVVASELGEDVAVVELFTESLGPAGSEAETLIGMLEANADLITEALGGR